MSTTRRHAATRPDQARAERPRSRLPLGLIARGVLLLGVTVTAYVLTGAALLNNASAAYFPRQLGVLLATAAVAALAVGILWWRPRSLVIAVMAFAAAVAILHPGLQGLRLELLATSVPVVEEEDATGAAVRCFCTTRASLHEFFGVPAFIGGGDRGSALIYAYERKIGDRRLVLYMFGTQTGSDDRVVAIRSEAFEPSRFGLRAW